MDGNISLALLVFTQLYVIKAIVAQVHRTAIYCLLEKKLPSTIYEIIFKVILKQCGNRGIYPDPLFINVDFEPTNIENLQI